MTEQQLQEIEAAARCNADPTDPAIPELIAEVRRLRVERDAATAEAKRLLASLTLVCGGPTR